MAPPPNSENENSETDAQNERNLSQSDNLDAEELSGEHGHRDGSTSPSHRRSGSSRGRHRRHRHHSHRRSCFRFKRKESNLIAAVCSVIVLVLLCTALAEPQWFFLSGGGCRHKNGTPIHYLGVGYFFYSGEFTYIIQGKYEVPTYHYGAHSALVNCVTAQSVSIMKSIISLVFFGVAFSLFAFLLDLTGPTHKLLRMLRRHGCFNILTVTICIIVNGFSYWMTENIVTFQRLHKPTPGSKPLVEFSISFYLVTAAGATSVIAAACNLLRRHPPPPQDCADHRNDRDRLLEDYEGMDFGADPYSPMSFMPPPPPYSP